MNEVILSPAAYADVKRMLDADKPSFDDNPLFPVSTFAGLAVRVSHTFPMRLNCTACGSSGEGTESTYCPACGGAGETVAVGLMRDGPKTVLFNGPKLPRKFDPYFPPGIVQPPRMCRGLP